MHQSVLLEEAIEFLAVSKTDTVLDGTLGGAGHFSSLLNLLSEEGTLIGIDADEEAVQRARDVVEKMHAVKTEARDAQDEVRPLPRIELVEDNFRNIDHILDEHNISEINKSLFDLGWSSFQLSRGRGFSFQTDEPLLMTYGDPSTQQTAAEVVNALSEAELVNMLFTLGEEQFARRIAKGIVESRKRKRIETTVELVDVIQASTPSWYHHRRLNPATKTFQALRMYVNDELGALTDALTAAINRTSQHGRIAVITFHSIEDRIVKNTFRTAVQEGTGRLVNKKPILPSDSEQKENPRSRSAKLRVFERLDRVGQ